MVFQNEDMFGFEKTLLKRDAAAVGHNGDGDDEKLGIGKLVEGPNSGLQWLEREEDSGPFSAKRAREKKKHEK